MNPTYSSGKFIIKPSNQYSLIFFNCSGYGQENGTIKCEGRKILFIADSSFNIGWSLTSNKPVDTIWKPSHFQNNYLYLNGGLHENTGDKYYKQYEYHK